MTTLVVSGTLNTYTHVTISDYVASSDCPSDDELRRTLQHIEERKARIAATLLSLQRQISEMSRDLNTRNAAANAAILTLTRKIAELQEMIKENIEKNREPDDLDDEFSEFDQKHQQSHTYEETNDESPEVDLPKTSAEVKRLFRLIAHRTHPDRTDDPELHLIFLSAKEYRRSNDVAGLRDLWNLLQGELSALLNKLLKQVEEERQELRNLQFQLDFLKTGMDYSVLQAYKADKNGVYWATAAHLEERRKQLAAKLIMLQRMTGTYEPPPNFVTFSFG